MRFVELEQGTQEWLSWRRGLLTASDAASILGKSPYCTAYQCWQRKLGLIPEQTKTPAMQRGINDEPIARAMFNEFYGYDMQPAIIQNEDKPFIGASLDGICKDPEWPGYFIGLEIKSQNIEKIKDEGIPEFHYAQLQHQFLASGGLMDYIYYVSYQNGQIYDIKVQFDNHWICDYAEKAKEFWGKVVKCEAPDLSEKDYKDMSGNHEWRAFSAAYWEICQNIKELEEQKDSYRKKLSALAQGINCCGNGIKVCHRTTKGRIDYDSIPELQGIDLELYRKKSSTSCAILLDAKKDF